MRFFGDSCTHFIPKALQCNSMLLLQKLGMLYHFILEDLEPSFPKLNKPAPYTKLNLWTSKIIHNRTPSWTVACRDTLRNMTIMHDDHKFIKVLNPSFFYLDSIVTFSNKYVLIEGSNSGFQSSASISSPSLCGAHCRLFENEDEYAW